MSTNWYVASLLTSRPGGSSRSAIRRCQYLIEARSHDEAYDRALELGTRAAAADGRFAGVADLVLVHERPGDGAEILWSESEVADTDIESRLLPKEDMRAFREKPSGSGWYLGSVILREVHDEGSHRGKFSLVWTNTYLVKAAGPDEAYAKVVRIGTGQGDDPGSHRCDGEKAHWEFRGARDIIPVLEAPAPDALLWCDDLDTAADSPDTAVPEKSELTVFRWQAQQVRRVQ